MLGPGGENVNALVYSRLKAKNHDKNCYEALVAALSVQS